MLKERKSRDVGMRSTILDFHTNFEDKIWMLSAGGSSGGCFSYGQNSYHIIYGMCIIQFNKNSLIYQSREADES